MQNRTIRTLLLALTIAVTGAMAHASDPDCTVIGHLVFSIASDPTTTCTTSTYTDTCADGSTVLRTTETCVTTREVTVTTWELVLPPVPPHPDDPWWFSLCFPEVISETSYIEIIGTQTIEHGELCPDQYDECCRLTETGWEYEYSNSPETEVEHSHGPIECPDGSAGVRTTTVTTMYINRRVRTYSKYEPTGNCPDDPCEETVTYGNWERCVQSRETKWADACPGNPG